MSVSELEAPAQRMSVASMGAGVSDVERVQTWLAHFEDRLAAGDREGLESLFVADSHWRDLFAITWNLTPTISGAAIAARFAGEQKHVKARNFRIAAGRTGPRRVRRTGEAVIESIFEFETEAARGAGILRLPVAQPEKAWVMSTSLRELKGHEEPVGDRRPNDSGGRVFGGESWAVRREREQRYDDREPAVLIVGGGHNGLCIAAKLRLLGVDALVVERLPRVGDVWRKRYAALALHNKLALNHLPFMPFPTSWPQYPTKDMLGEWIESYATAMECNVWTNSAFVSGRYREDEGEWEALVRRADGSERVFRPRHLVFANGVLGEPRIPAIPGLDAFAGEVVHSHVFDSGAAWKGRNVMVLGAGNTAHDIAQDLHGHGARVTMVQRGSVTVFSVKAVSFNHAVHYTEGLPLDDADLVISAGTFPLNLRGYQLNVQRMLEIDRDLLEGLNARGFKTDIGDQGGGHQMKIRVRHGGYYLNVGCSDLIAGGEIGIRQWDDIVRFGREGAVMKDGSTEKADLLVIAAGYQSIEEVVETMLGSETAAKIGRIWGPGPDGELNNMYKPTAQKGLWFAGGGFAQGRIWSHYIALQIKARELGLVA
jgi:putative flavoprotein involved in K+ transport